MELLSVKVECKATCNHCGKTDIYIFHLNSDSLICNHCDKEFKIEVWTLGVEVHTIK